MSGYISSNQPSSSQILSAIKSHDEKPSELKKDSDRPQTKSTQTASRAAALARGEGLYSTPKVSTSPEGNTTITGGDSNSSTGGSVNNSWIATSTNVENEALGQTGMRIDRQEGTRLTINDDTNDHANHHVVRPDENNPVTLNTGNADGDTYNVGASASSVTTINGDGKGSVNGQRDTVNYRPHLHSPNSTSQIKLENFNPSRTDLKIEGKSLFGEGIDSNFSGTIDFSRKPDSLDIQFKLNLDPSN